MPLKRAIVFTGILFVTLMILHSQPGLAAPQAPDSGEVQPKWVKSLPAGACSSQSLGTYCHKSSPAVADVNGDGRKDIVVATNNGHIVAYAGDGSRLWDRDIAPLFGLGGGQQTIASSPAVGDINADGRPEIVVGTGDLDQACHPGGVVVLDRGGSPVNHWPILTKDNNIAPSNCPDPVFSTPALGDLDNDGDLEIVVGSFDNRIYAWHHDGRLLDGFPGKSDLYVTMGWPNMREQLGDTIWSSPALADLNNDGYTDIVIGSDEGMVDDTFGNPNWDCPYDTPSGATEGYCGGTLYAYDRHGEFLPGYPKHILETIQSSPAIVDGNHDGRYEVYVGTGGYYHRNSPDKPTHGFRLFGWSHNGAALPGWDGGRPTQSVMPASPAIGDVAGDAAPEIVALGLDGRLYAWHVNGTVVGGFPMLPRNYMGNPSEQDVGKSVVLGDYDGDGKMEIFLTSGWTVVIVDGNGQSLTNTNANDDRSAPFYVTKGLLQNNPALGDVDGDGELELIAQNSELTVWDLPGGAKTADWPIFRHDAARTGAVVKRQLTVDPPEITLAGSAGEDQVVEQELTVRVGAPFRWEAKVVSGSGVRLLASSGEGYGVANVPLAIEWQSSMGPGEYALGLVEITVSGDDLILDTPKRTVPVRLELIRTSAELFFPAVVSSASP